MKYVIVLPGGAADEPYEQLNGQTPIEAAKTPNMDWISRNGRQGCVVTAPRGIAPAIDVTTFTLFGYDPLTEFAGRAPLEAASHGITSTADELIFRCNFVTITDGIMQDFTAGHISQRESDQLIAALNDEIGGRCKFHTGLSYRNLMVVSDTQSWEPVCNPPHCLLKQPVNEHGPVGAGADWLLATAERAGAVLAGHDVNLVRGDLTENPATDIWLWGHGRSTTLQPFEERFGIRGAVIAAVDLIRGIARTLEMPVVDVPGTTGYVDTDYDAKGAAAVDALEDVDLVVVHVQAPDETADYGDVAAKVEAIQRIDEAIVGPLLEALRATGSWKIMVAPLNAASFDRRIPPAAAPPFCVAGDTVHPVQGHPFSEHMAAKSDLQITPGQDLMEYFLH